MQVDVHQYPLPERRDQGDQRRRFLRRTVGAERTVGIQRIGIPAMDALVAPRTDARHHQQVGLARVVAGALLEELQRTVHATGFVAMHAAGDQHRGQAVVPVAAADGVQRVGFAGTVVDRAVLLHVETPAQRIDRHTDIVHVATPHALLRAPLGFFCHAPGLARGTDGMEARWQVHGDGKVWTRGRHYTSGVRDARCPVIRRPSRRKCGPAYCARRLHVPLHRPPAHPRHRPRPACRARSWRGALGGLARPRTHPGRGVAGGRGLALARHRLPVSGQAQGPDAVLVGRRGLRAGVALCGLADQAGAHRMGRAHVRDRRHQDASDVEGVAAGRCAAQGRAGGAAGQGGARYLRWPRLLRRLLSGGRRHAHPFVREERGRALATHPQSLVAGPGCARTRWSP